MGDKMDDEIDAAFAAMADDEEYQAEARRIAEEFSVADWEAWLLGEGQNREKISPTLGAHEAIAHYEERDRH